MALKFYESPFHVTHDEDKASKMAMKMDLSIMLSKLIRDKGWTQAEAAANLNVQQSRVSDLMNSKIDKFTIDAMFDMLDALGFHVRMTMPAFDAASITISRSAING